MTSFCSLPFGEPGKNQLFLTNSVSQGIDRFRPVYDWFDKALRLIAPDSRFELFHLLFNSGHPINNVVNEALSQFDTGIVRLSDEKIPFDSISMPESLRVELQENIKEGMGAQLLGMSTHDRTVVFRKDGELIAKKLVTYHPKSDGTEVRFDIRQESDGTRRMIDLLPAFIDLLQAFPDQSGQEAGKVYVIDEIDRSLHTLLVRSLIEAYLEKCSIKTRSQMLLTTHDVLLMDQHLLRRDEMWVTERDDSGISQPVSLQRLQGYPVRQGHPQVLPAGTAGRYPPYFAGRRFNLPRPLRGKYEDRLMPRGRRHFRRVPGRRSYRSLFVLAVEGTRTEPQYFSIFNVKRSVHVKVLTQPGGTDPFHVLKRMERYLSQERLKASDQAWLVVDKDHWTDEQLTKLHSWAQKHQSYGFVLSNPNFEYWLLLHFEEGNGHFIFTGLCRSYKAASSAL